MHTHTHAKDSLQNRICVISGPTMKFVEMFLPWVGVCMSKPVHCFNAYLADLAQPGVQPKLGPAKPGLIRPDLQSIRVDFPWEFTPYT